MIMANETLFCDPKIIAALYHASSHVVQLPADPGICCLVESSVDENICATAFHCKKLSGAQPYLLFHNNHSDEGYGSADWMPS